ncbi:MAG: HAD family hydrolase [Thermodesulfobacteriota bacterium]|nr:MAG: HAD family hydrolase [Thermodesulfobacteriota bacterium]
MKKTAGAVFLDRDGTINEDVGYLSDPDGLILIEGATKAIRLFNERDLKVIVLSNQSGVGRGYYTDAQVHAVNRRLKDLLGREGAIIDGVYYCNHHPDIDCQCRKPLPGLVELAALEHEFDSKKAYMVGDKASDVGLARNIGAKGILVLTGKGAGELEGMEEAPDFIARDILEAAAWILADLERPPL